MSSTRREAAARKRWIDRVEKLFGSPFEEWQRLVLQDVSWEFQKGKRGRNSV